MKAALALALQRHPLLSALINEADHEQPHWLPCPYPPAPIQWLEQEPTQGFPRAQHIDMRERPAFHLTVVQGATRSDLVLQFHHAACDGIGAMDFAADLLTAYANVLARTNKYPFKPLDAGRLRARGDLPLTGWKLFRWALRHCSRVNSLWRLYRCRPSAVVPHRIQEVELEPRPAFPEAVIHHFTQAESVALARRAYGAELSLNALLARDLFLAIAEWRRRNGITNEVWLRLMAPVNMRTPGDRRMPAANVVSAVFLDRRLAAVDSSALLDGINRFMANVKSDNLGLPWLLGLPLIQRLPRAWGKIRRSKRRCLFSALLTNLGPVLAGSPLPRIDRRLLVGDTILDEVEFLPVVRSLQCLGISVSNYAGRMSLGMRYHSGVLPPEKAKELLDVYVEALRASITR